MCQRLLPGVSQSIGGLSVRVRALSGRTVLGLGFGPILDRSISRLANSPASSRTCFSVSRSLKTGGSAARLILVGLTSDTCKIYGNPGETASEYPKHVPSSGSWLRPNSSDVLPNAYNYLSMWAGWGFGK